MVYTLYYCRPFHNILCVLKLMFRLIGTHQFQPMCRRRGAEPGRPKRSLEEQLRQDNCVTHEHVFNYAHAQNGTSAFQRRPPQDRSRECSAVMALLTGAHNLASLVLIGSGGRSCHEGTNQPRDRPVGDDTVEERPRYCTIISCSCGVFVCT